MSVIQALLMGIVQGLTEFLPVSSSGHLAIIKALTGVETDGGILYDVLLHFATLIVIFIVYYKDVLKLLGEFCGICADCFTNIVRYFKNISAINPLKYKPIVTNVYRKLALMYVVSTIPAVIMGALLSDVLDTVGDNLLVVGFCLLGTGGILFLSDTLPLGNKRQKEANYGDAFSVGIGQAFAVLPGLSRSGTTITACMLCGFDRKFAFKYSFIMSMPAVFGALILELFKLGDATAVTTSGLGCILGMIAAGGIGYFALKFMDNRISHNSFKPFWIYCLCAGGISLIIFLVKL